MKFYAALSALAAASFVPLGASLAYTYPALTQNLKAAVSVRPSYPGPPAGRRTSAAATTRAPRLLAHATPAVAEVEAAEIGEKYSYLENDVKRAIEILLSDHDDQPLGSLSADVLDLALPACASLASARTTEAAEAVEKIVRRVEGERAAGSEKILPWRILYSVVSPPRGVGPGSAALLLRAVVSDRPGKTPPFLRERVPGKGIILKYLPHPNVKMKGIYRLAQILTKEGFGGTQFPRRHLRP